MGLYDTSQILSLSIDLGITVAELNYMTGLTGLLAGFVFALALIYATKTS